MMEEKKIYTFLAGPDCFYPDFEQRKAEKRRLCEQYGLTPLPNEEFPDDMGNPVTDHSICWGNIKRLEKCELILANLEAFRGPEPDSGTVFECVYAYAKGKKVYAYYDYKDMVTAVEKLHGPVTWREVAKPDGSMVNKPFDKDGNAIENWGKMLNLMLTGTFTCIHGTFEDLLEVVAKDLGLTKKAE